MSPARTKNQNLRNTCANTIVVLSLAFLLSAIPANAENHGKGNDRDRNEDPIHFFPGNLVVSRSVYDNNASNIAVGTQLPPNCAKTVGPCAPATNNGTYPFVFNNVIPDPAFGITSKIFLDQITPFGFLLNSLEIPNSTQRNIYSSSNQLVTSFSSKSEMALHLSTDGSRLTFMGYVAPVDTIDASNSNTPGAVDPNQSRRHQLLPRRRHRRPLRQLHLHRDQRLQWQQRPLRHSQQHERRKLLLRCRQRGQWFQPTAQRRHPRRRSAVHRPLHRARELPDSWHSNPARQLLRHPPRG